MHTIASLIWKSPELMERHAVLINRDHLNKIVKYVFKDNSSLELKL
jgi:hypothetical protein